MTRERKNLARSLGVSPKALARLWDKNPPDSWLEVGEEAWSLVPRREASDHVVGLKSIAHALGVAPRAVRRWLLKPGGRYHLSRIMLDNVWLFFHQGASRGKRKGAAPRPHDRRGRFVKRRH